MKYNTYVGARYVPLFDGEWDNAKTYEPLTIVSYQGSSYTSKTIVPKGAKIDNEKFWACTGNYNAQIEMYRRETNEVKGMLNERIKHHETVYDMRNDNTLNEGMIVQTKGFYEVNDGGSATYILYRASDVEGNGYNTINVGNELMAVLVVGDSVNVKQCGAKGDGVNDDTNAIQSAINKSSIINFECGKVYAISRPITIPSNKLILLNGSTIKLVSEHPISMFRIIDCENATIENGKFVSIWEVGYESKEIPIVVSSSKDITFNNIEVTNCICDGMYIGYEYWYSGTDAFITSNIKIKDCYIHDVGRNGISLVSGDNVIIENTKFSNIANNLPKACIDIEPETNNVNPHNLHISNVVIKGCVFEQTNGNNGVIISCPIDTLTFTTGEVVIEDCTFDGANIRYIHTKDSSTDINAIQTVFRNLYFKRPYLYGICVYNHPLTSKMVIENITSEKMVNTNDQPTYYGLITMLVGTDAYELGNVTIKDINLIGKGKHWNSLLSIAKEYSETTEFENKYKNCYFDFNIKNFSGEKIGSFNRLDLDTTQNNIVNITEANSGTDTSFRSNSHIIYRSVPTNATLTMDSDWFREREIEVYDFNGRSIKLSKPEGYSFAENNSANYCSFTAPSNVMHTIKIRLYNGKIYIDTDTDVTKTFS